VLADRTVGGASSLVCPRGDSPGASLLAANLPRHGQTALDLGCGAGRHTVLLAERYRQVLAVDIADRMLHIARGMRPAPPSTTSAAACWTSPPTPTAGSTSSCPYTPCTMSATRRWYCRTCGPVAPRRRRHPGRHPRPRECGLHRGSSSGRQPFPAPPTVDRPGTGRRVPVPGSAQPRPARKPCRQLG